MKYIIFRDNEIVIFSESLKHSDIANSLKKKVISAGFVHLYDNKIYAGGESMTLGIEARAEDGEIIKRKLGDY